MHFCVYLPEYSPERGMNRKKVVEQKKPIFCPIHFCPAPCAFRVRRDSSVGRVTGYGLEGWGSFSVRGKGFSLFHSLQTGPGAHPASYPTGTGNSVIKRPESEAYRSHPFNAEVKNDGAIPPLAHMSSWHST
jgi:hypothetical protein